MVWKAMHGKVVSRPNTRHQVVTYRVFLNTEQPRWLLSRHLEAIATNDIRYAENSDLFYDVYIISFNIFLGGVVCVWGWGWGNGGGNLYSSVSLQHLFITHCFETVGSDRFDCSLVCWVFVVWFPFQHSSLLRCVLARWFLNAGFKDLPPHDQARDRKQQIQSQRSQAKDPKPEFPSQES